MDEDDDDDDDADGGGDRNVNEKEHPVERNCCSYNRSIILLNLLRRK
jgi:hypothetical protein